MRTQIAFARCNRISSFIFPSLCFLFTLNVFPQSSADEGSSPASPFASPITPQLSTHGTMQVVWSRLTCISPVEQESVANARRGVTIGFSLQGPKADGLWSSGDEYGANPTMSVFQRGASLILKVGSCAFSSLRVQVQNLQLGFVSQSPPRSENTLLPGSSDV